MIRLFLVSTHSGFWFRPRA